MRRRPGEFMLRGFVRTRIGRIGIAIVSGVGAIAILALCHAPLASAPPNADPIPIRRILLPPDRLAKEMERVGLNKLIQIPRSDFEDLVQQASQAAESAGRPPRLLESRYRAAWTDGGLVGSAEWTIHHEGRASGRLNLQSLQLAIRRARWHDKEEAVISFLDDQPNAPLELLVDKSGVHRLALEWSAFATLEPRGARIDLRFPGCPIATLDLELPADLTPQANREHFLLSGPRPGSNPGWLQWRLSFGGRTAAAQGLPVALVLRRSPIGNQPGPLLRPYYETTQRLNPGQIDCNFEIDLLIQRGDVRELTFECDKALRIIEVQIPNVERWETVATGQSTRLHVFMREPYTGGRISIRAIAPLPPAESAWTSPMLRVAGGFSRGERILLHVHPDLALDDWRPGAFRLRDQHSSADRVQVLALEEQLSASPSRPQARVRPIPAVFDIHQSLDWQIEPAQMTVVGQLTVDLHRGVLTQLPISIPADWHVEGVEAAPVDPGLRYNVTPAPGGSSQLSIEPGHSLNAEGAAAKWTIRLRRALQFPPAAAAAVPLPDLLPRGQRRREGSLIARWSPTLSVLNSSTTSANRRELSLPLTASRLEGSLQIQLRPNRIQARCEGEFAVSGGRLRVKHLLQVTPLSGAVREVLVFCNRPSVPWSWRTRAGAVQVQRIEPYLPRELPSATLPLAQTPWPAIVGFASIRSTGGHWLRLIFDRPLSATANIEMTADLPAHHSMIRLPLLAVPMAERFEGRARLLPSPTGSWIASTTSVRTVAARETSGGPIDFRYALPPFDLTIKSPSQRDAQPVVERAALLLRLAGDDQLVAHFVFTIRRWSNRELQVKLPGGAELLEARIGGKAAIASIADANVISLPWMPGDEAVTGVIVYRQPVALRPWPTKLVAIAPELPMPAAVHYVWRLPSSVQPLWSSQWRRLYGQRTHDSPEWSAILPLDRAVQRARVNEAAKAVGPSSTLGEALFRLASEYGRDGGTIVLDINALQADGIHPEDAGFTAESAAWWESIGIVHVACSSGPLLTTKKQAAVWREQAPPDIESAVGEAIRLGRDRTGRFRTVVDWLQSDESESMEPDADALRATSDWESQPGRFAERVWIVPVHFARCIGIALALALGLLIGQAFAARWRARWACLLTLAAVAALAWLWAPASLSEIAIWPFVAMAVAGLGGTSLRWISISRPRLPKARSVLVVATVTILMGLSGHAADSTPYPVYIVPGKPERVLAPPELLDKLRGLVHGGAPTAGAILVEAGYEGKATESQAEIEGRFVVRCLGEKPASLILPLGGAQIREATLDGVAALPKAAGERYVIDVAGKGRHSLVIRFVVPVTGKAERELHFTVPEVATSFVRFEAPPGAQHLQALSFRGAQRVESQDVAGPVLQGDLGRAAAVVLRWRQSGVIETAIKTQLRELNLWEVHEASARLTSVFRINLGETHVRSLEFDVPPELEAANVDVRTVDKREALNVGVRHWQTATKDNRQRLHVDLTSPVNGQVQATVELLPRTGFNIRPVLPVPVFAGDANRESFVAVRTQGWEAKVIEARGCVRISEDQFFREQWQPLRIDANPSAAQLAFQRSRPDAHLRIALEPRSAKNAAAQSIRWIVGPGRAAVEATGYWNEPTVPGFVEWDIPANVAISDIQGAGLRHWSRRGARLQAWFDRDAGDANAPINLQLTGWLARPSQADQNAKTPFVAPTFSLPDTTVQSTTLDVRSATGWRIRLQDAGPFHTLPDNDLPGQRWSGQATIPGAATFQTFQTQGGVAGASVVHHVGLADRLLSSTNHVTIEPLPNLPNDRPNTIWIDVSRSDATRLTLDLPPGARLRETLLSPGRTTWSIDMVPGKAVLTISARRPLATPQEFVVPLVQVRNARNQSRQLILQSPDLQPMESSGIRPGESRDPTATSWHIDPEVARLRVRYLPGGGARAPGVNVITSQMTAATDPSGAWSLRAEYAVLALSENDWHVTWPAGVEPLAATLDGRSLPLSKPSLGFSLAPGVHDLRLVWRLPATIKQGQPNFALPVLPAGQASSTLWQVNLPDGYRVEQAHDFASMSVTGREVQIAAAWDRAMQMHADHAPADILRALTLRRDAAVRLAQYRVKVMPPLPNEAGPGDVPLADWLQQAIERRSPAAVLPNRAESPPFAERFQGSPTWVGRTDGPPPRLEIAAEPAASREQIALTALIALALTAAAVAALRLGKMEKAA